MRMFRRRSWMVVAEQFRYGADSRLVVPEGFKLSPPPTDFGVSRSCVSVNGVTDIRFPGQNYPVLLHPGDWVVYREPGAREALRMTDREFQEEYEEER